MTQYKTATFDENIGDISFTNILRPRIRSRACLIAGYNPKKQRLDSVVKLQKDKSGL